MQYAKKRIFKTVICILMLSVILFNSYEKKVYADAGSIAIAGGSIAVGGLGAGALAGLGGPVVVAVILGGMAWGANVELTKASQQAGMTKTQFVQNKINEYCQEAGKTAGAFNQAILNGTTVLNDGRIKLGNQAVSQLKQFYNWLFDNDMVQENNQSVNMPHISQNGHDIPVLKQGDSINVLRNNLGEKILTYVSGSYDIGVFLRNYSGSYYNLVMFTGGNYEGNTINITYGGQSQTLTFYTQYNGYSVTDIMVGQPFTDQVLSDSIPNLGGAGLSTIFNTFDGSFNVEGMDNAVSNDTFTGSKDDWENARDNVLNPTDNQSVVVNPGLIGNITIPADKDYTVDIKSYLEALQKILDKLNDITLPAIDDTDGIPTDLEIPDTDVLDPDITKEDDTDLPIEDDQTPIINDDPPNPEEDPGLTQAPLKFDLKNIFPFCIPFDVKDMLNMLKAEPVAPSYQVDWHIPIVNTDLEFTVDLSAFNSVAAICRRMELLLVIIGLAIATRSLFIRG